MIVGEAPEGSECPRSLPSRSPFLGERGVRRLVRSVSLTQPPVEFEEATYSNLGKRTPCA
jgi:hypothetical protein